MNKTILRIIFLISILANHYELADIFSSSHRIIELTDRLKLLVQTKLNDLEKENAEFKVIAENLRYLNDHAQKDANK
jgi:hypothetical protein